MSTEQAPSIETISKLCLSPGDILVLRSERRMTSEQYEAAYAVIKRAYDAAGLAFTVAVLIIDDDAEFQVISGATTGAGGLESLGPTP